MKVLFWSEMFWPNVGGIETLSAESLPILGHRGFDFQVVTSHSQLDLPDTGEFAGIPIRRFRFRAAVEDRDVAEIIRVRASLADLVRRFDPDLVHLSGLGIGLFFHHDVVAKLSLPTVITLHNSIAGAGAETVDTITQQSLRAADSVVTCSRVLLDEVLTILPEIRERASAIPNAIELPSIEPDPLDLEVPIIMCIGRMTRQKGFDLAVQGFAEVAQRHPLARLVFVGDGDERAALEAMARELGLQERVEFVGMLPPEQVPEQLNRAAVVLMPSRWEGLPIVGIQAAMMGRPIVGTDVSGLAEVILNGRTGVVVRRESPQSVAQGVAALLDDPEWAKSLGAAARNHALSQFTMTRYVDDYASLYRCHGTAPGAKVRT